MRILLSFVLLFVTGFIQAQQWMQFSQQASYASYLNPSYVGFNSNLNATVAHRSQYVGLGNRAIASQYVSFSSPFLSSKLGLGFRVLNDFIGLQRYTNVEINSAYHILQKKSKLSLGLSLGMVQLNIKGDQLTAPDGSYLPGLVNHNDNLLPNVSSSGLAPTFSFGVLYALGNWELGMAIQNVNSPKIKLSEVGSGTFISLTRTINVHSSYVIRMKNIQVTPSFFCKTDLIKWQAQLNVMLDWKKISTGVGFRGYNGLNNDALIGYFGWKIKDIVKVGYSYDYNLSYLNNSNSGSHEISLKFDLPKSFAQNVKSNIIFNPRYL